MSTPRKRGYTSASRAQAAELTKARILRAAKRLFARHGIDGITIEQISEKANVASSTVYALFKSKVGILRALMTDVMFGPPFKASQSLLSGVDDARQLIALTAHVARAIYENENIELGLLGGTSGLSPVLRKLEQEFEDVRFQMQHARVQLLYAQGKARPDLDVDTARRILWMYTGRDIYRMLVTDGGWSPDRYQEWLSGTLVDALVAKGP